MDTQHHRLQQARVRAGYSTASDAARNFGWNENTYRSHENGERGLKQEVARRYASAFEVSSAWLLTGEGDSGVRFNSALELEGLIFEKGSIGSARQESGWNVRSLPFIPLVPISAFVIYNYVMQPRYSYGDLVIVTETTEIWDDRQDAVIRFSDKTKKFGPVLEKNGDRIFLPYDELPVRLPQSAIVSPVLCVIPAGWHRIRHPPLEIS